MSSLPQASLSGASVEGVPRHAWFVSLAGLYALYASLAPLDRSPVACPLRIVTGHRCPLCGLTRATRALTRAEFRQALALHPLAPLLWVIALAYMALGDPEHNPLTLDKEIANGRQRTADRRCV
jgi:hypothetical protein